MEVYTLNKDESERLKEIKKELDNCVLNQKIISQKMNDEIDAKKRQTESQLKIEIDKITDEYKSKLTENSILHSKIADRYRKYMLYLIIKHDGKVSIKDGEKTSFEFIEDENIIVRFE